VLSKKVIVDYPQKTSYFSIHYLEETRIVSVSSPSFHPSSRNINCHILLWYVYRRSIQHVSIIYFFFKNNINCPIRISKCINKYQYQIRYTWQFFEYRGSIGHNTLRAAQVNSPWRMSESYPAYSPSKSPRPIRPTSSRF
jgi:hypothetical protein